MKKIISIFWFREDLRLSDNPGLTAASEAATVLPIYILDELVPPPFELGGASKVYLHHSLASLDRSLDGQLNFYVGKTNEVILKLIAQFQIEHVFYNCSYDPRGMRDEAELKASLNALGIACSSFNASYLWDPKEVKKEDGGYYKVFGAYKRKVRLLKTREALQAPKKLNLIKDQSNPTSLADFKLIQNLPWQKKIEEHWNFGETEAQKKLKFFMDHGIKGYKIGRDYPAGGQTSKLSMNLHFGEISPTQILKAVQQAEASCPQEDTEHFISELIWREFSYYLLYHFNKLHSDNFISKFDNFPWEENEGFLKAWQTGQTGYPLVDAGMRELWQTGYMHNRVRMVTASFLIKNLKLHWHHGRDWFWDCLVDADIANNSASWQWVAGCGVDAAPYFRIFNPTLQGEKFDKKGEYVKKFITELKNLPEKYLFKPWTAPPHVLYAAGLKLGEDYPRPIVDLTLTRNEALEAFKNL